MRNQIARWIAAGLLLAISFQALAQPKIKRKPAQDPPRFSPPRPPALDQDFDDPGDDELENGDMPSRAQTPPPAPPPTSYGGGYTPPPSTASANGTAPKVKFQIADGEFYEKGKKRGRSPQNRRSQSN